MYYDDDYNNDNGERSLYELIEEYKEVSTIEEKDKVFKEFCSYIWSSDNRRYVYKKSLHFRVRDDLLNTNIGKIFDMWSDIEYYSYRRITKDENWYCIIRQKINNIYSLYFDKRIITHRDYMNKLDKPKRMYYAWISGVSMDADYVTDVIDKAMSDAHKLKVQHQKEKMELSWTEYKKLIESFMRKCFDRIKLTEDYEKDHPIILKSNLIDDDHVYVKYINTCIYGEIRKWQKKYYGIRDHKKYRRCTSCGCLYEASEHDYSSKFCPACRRQRRLNGYKKYNKKRITT